MKSKKHHLFCAMGVALLFPSAAFGTQPISIVNAQFENPVLTDGQLSAEAIAVPNWSSFNGSNVRVLNPSTADLSAEAPQGANVALIIGTAAENGLSQVVTSSLHAGANYVLTVKVANTRFTTGFPGYRVQLVANNTVLAEDNNSLSIAEDTVVTSTVNYIYNAGAHAGLVGQPLEIRLLSKGLALNEEVAYDDVQLSVTLTNPVANLGGPYSVPFGGSLSLNGGGSLPPAGQSITTYEWDLDNDGDFDEAITGATPASITDVVLKATYGMAIGANTIRLRVTDNSAPTPKTATGTTTVTLAAPIACQLGVVNLSANGGINPNTGNPWQAGDRYRIAFHTLGTTQTTSNDPNFYNDFATAEAWTVPALQGAYWRAMVTVNLDGTTTQALSPKRHVRDNTGTGDLTGGFAQGGAGEPVYATNGTTCIARNNADIWNAWSNPFENSPGVPNATGNGNNAVRWASGTGPTPASQVVHYSPFLDQNGGQLVNPDNVHGKDIATGCNVDGSHVNALGNTTDVTTINRGNTNANTTGRIWNRFTDATTTLRAVYAISVPLTVIDVSETVAPTVVSIVDDRSGANAILGLDTVTYTVTFSEPIDASTVNSSDFGFGGTATATIDRVFGTLDSRALEITVTPTSAGSLILQVAAGAVLKDPVGNALDTTTAIPDDTTITVVEDVTAPTLVSMVDDREGASLVVGTGSIVYTVTFDEAMAAGTVGASDFGNAGTATLSVDLVAATVDPAVFNVTVTPTSAGTLQLQIAAGAELTDLIGNPLNTSVPLPDNTTITIDPDTTPPVVDALSPANGATSTSTGPILVATFSEKIAKGTGNVQIRRTSDDTLVDTINVTSGAVTVSGTKATITLGVVLDSLVGYYVLVDSGAFTDMFDNAFAGIAAKTQWGFTTGEFGLIGVTAAGQFFPALFEEYGGQSWILIGRGREGWEFDTDGQGAAGEVGINLKTPAGFAPKALSDAIVNDLLLQAGKSFPNDVVLRVMRASTIDGTGDYQELRYTNFTGFPNENTEFTFFFHDANKRANLQRVNAPAGLPGASIGTSTDTIRDHQAGGNNANRAFTWDWNGHNFQKGFSMGQTVLGVDNNDPNTFLWEFTTENHAIPYSEVWLQLEVPTSDGNPFGNWAKGPFAATLTDSNPSLDFDGGGLETGIEWVVGGDPTNGSDDAGKAPTFSNSDPNNFVFTYRRSDAAQADPKTAIAVQYSTDLVGWTAATNGVAGVTIDASAVPEAGFRTVVVSIPKALAGGSSRLFARLNVVVTP